MNILKINGVHFLQLKSLYTFREQLLHAMLRPMSDSRATTEMYEDQSFLRNSTLLTFLMEILEPLSEFHIVLEKSLTHGISSLC